MSYIGNPPAERFTSFDYQDLTGGSGTSFTLTHPVGNAQEILVMVNNVVQEPGVAYTVSGTALTMTGSIASTDDFYIVYRGKAIQTATHPSDRALTATDGTFTGDASVTGDLTVDTNTLVVDATNNRVGIGTTSPSNDIEISGTNPTIRLTDTNGTNQYSTISGNAGSVVIKSDQEDSATGSIRFFVGGGEKGRFLEGGGLTFNGDTAAANALDDYEEGSYTPQISATDGIGTLTYSYQVGRYTKVGNRVMFNAYVQINNKGTAAGLFRITTPFTPANITQNHVPIAHWINGSENNQAFEGERVTYAYLAANEPIVRFYASNGDGGLNHLSAAHVKNGTDFMISGTFQV